MAIIDLPASVAADRALAQLNVPNLINNIINARNIPNFLILESGQTVPPQTPDGTIVIKKS